MVLKQYDSNQFEECTKLKGGINKMIVLLGYIVPTIVAAFFIGFFAPLVGIVVGFLIHIIVLQIRISNKIDRLIDRLDASEKINP